MIELFIYLYPCKFKKIFYKDEMQEKNISPEMQNALR